MIYMTPRELEILKTFHGAFTDANRLLMKEGFNFLRFQLIDGDNKGTICESSDEVEEMIFYAKKETA